MRRRCRGGVTHEIIQLEGDNNPKPYTANTDVYWCRRAIISSWATIATIPANSRVPPDRGGVGYVPFENLIGRAEMSSSRSTARRRGKSGGGRGRCAGIECSMPFTEARTSVAAGADTP